METPSARPAPLVEPGQRLHPSPGRDRPWRVLITLIGGVTVTLLVLAMGASTTATWLSGRSFTEIPAVTELGDPKALSVSTDQASVHVLPSPEVQQVTLALVRPGQRTLPAAGQQVRARIVRRDGDGAASVTVEQPDLGMGVPWTGGYREVLLLVPAGRELSLEVATGVGDVRVEGAFSAVDVRSEVGDLRLGPLTASGELTAAAEVGDVEVELDDPAPATVRLDAALGSVRLQLPPDAAAEVVIDAEFGDVAVAAPGDTRWQVDAFSELGETQIDPMLRDGAGEPGTLTVTTELGDVSVTR
ncbi:hypothetical protein DXU92_08715 [Brachybacterium saurashtrense]|uniref:Uncharacterized protein n=2 Tax=Brachybacterium saurashtrense TaxID=556288 RepID=A0A345YLJ8_9MICO|nr:hypothetical protein DWV08_03580 [Brachybacterium saurashtrense]RRR23412.1 hypothetical protein DXU92_08715 [Brachybacterium saurashtrense]